MYSLQVITKQVLLISILHEGIKVQEQELALGKEAMLPEPMIKTNKQKC